MASNRSPHGIARSARAGIVLTVLASASSIVAFQPDTPAVNAAHYAEAAQAALAPFKQQLMAALQQGLAAGPEPAIDACRVEAPRIAGSLGSRRVRMGRTSHRLRNPANAPRPWMQPILDEFRAATPGEIEYRLTNIEPGSIGYAEPIYVQPPCLQCHGTSIAPSLAKHIRGLYPEDRATGFAVGELRGLFWVELASEASLE